MKRIAIFCVALCCALSSFAADWDNQISISGGPFSPVTVFISYLANPMITELGYGKVLTIENPSFFGSYSFSYHKELVNWFQIGLKLNYEYSGFEMYANPTDPAAIAAIGSTHEKLGKSDAHMMLAQLSMQFTYLNTRIVKLYSGLDIGLGIVLWNRSDMFDKDLTAAALVNDDVKRIQELQKRYPNGKEVKWLPAGDITLLGLNVGTRVYGLAEINLGLDALVKVGIGARF